MNGCKLMLNTLGMARKAGKLIIGQDRVFSESKRKHLVAILTNDCSASVLRDAKACSERGDIQYITFESVDRYELGRRIGINAAQIVALPMGDGFAGKILSLYDRSDADE